MAVLVYRRVGTLLVVNGNLALTHSKFNEQIPKMMRVGRGIKKAASSCRDSGLSMTGQSQILVEKRWDPQVLVIFQAIPQMLAEISRRNPGWFIRVLNSCVFFVIPIVEACNIIPETNQLSLLCGDDVCFCCFFCV